MQAPKIDPEAQLLRPVEVATLLGISRSKAYVFLNSGAVPVVRVGSSLRVRRLALLRYIREQEGCPRTRNEDEHE